MKCFTVFSPMNWNWVISQVAQGSWDSLANYSENIQTFHLHQIETFKNHKVGFQIRFHFRRNPYFQNNIIMKELQLGLGGTNKHGIAFHFTGQLMKEPQNSVHQRHWRRCHTKKIRFSVVWQCPQIYYLGFTRSKVLGLISNGAEWWFHSLVYLLY